MNRSDIQLLQSIRSYPSVSILLPTHRTAPDNQQDPIRVKNLVIQAAQRLNDEFSKREAGPILDRLENLAREIDYRNALDGLALFVNHDIARAFYLPFRVQERVSVDETFATRDLVFALNRSPRYWVLALSEQGTRLYEGMRDTLIETTGHGFPMTHEGPGGATRLPGGIGARTSAYRDERHRQFFREVDAAFGRVVAVDPLPLALVGVDRYLSFFNEVAANRNLVVATISGNHDKTAPHDLAQLVWPPVKSSLAQHRNEVLTELDAAMSAKRYASGINEVWHVANEGRGATLLVEEDFHYPARLDPSGKNLIAADDPHAPDVITDAVDELIETVLIKGGRVVFMDNGALEARQRVAMILRY